MFRTVQAQSWCICTAACTRARLFRNILIVDYVGKGDFLYPRQSCHSKEGTLHARGAFRLWRGCPNALGYRLPSPPSPLLLLVLLLLGQKHDLIRRLLWICGPELPLNAAHDSLIPGNRDIQIIPGDGLLPRRAIPIKLHYPILLDMSNYRVRYPVIC